MFVTGGQGSGGWQIKNSVRLRSSATAYLNRTPASAGNRKTWTYSGWIKRGTIGSVKGILEGNAGVTDLTAVTLYNDIINIQDYSSSSGYNLVWSTTAVFRDPSAWYHIIVSYDTSQASSSNAVKVYVNGVQQTLSFTAYAGSYVQNRNSYVNATNAQRLGTYDSLANYFDGYLTEINFIDGQALDASYFGQYNLQTGVWQARQYTGTYGTNGFYLNFSNNSAATATTIGKDYSGNNNNWTPNNISVTPGTTYDSMIDSPMMYFDGTSTYGRGNYAVFNPVNVSGGGSTITDGNLGCSAGSTTTYGKILGSIGMTTGKWYWEVTITAVGSLAMCGVGDGTLPSGSVGLGGVAGELAYQSNGNKYTNASGSAYGATYTTNDVIGVAYDADAGSITFYKNNTSQGAITGLSGTKYPAVGSGGGTNPQYAINFGQRPFSYTPPTGFVALNTYNLPTPTIPNGAAYMAATTYTGTGAAQSISNGANNTIATTFQPDFVWMKQRSAVNDHILMDSVRGVTKAVFSNLTNAEVTDATRLTSFNSNGFTLGTSASTNTNAGTFVGWQWQAGAGTTTTNTTGSTTSTTSVGATQGFSVVTWTATGSSLTVGHGLGVAPSMIIAKSRVGSWDWKVYHSSIANTAALTLNTTAAADTFTYWNNTSPTSTVFSIGSSGSLNTSTNTMVAYCFSAVAGYSAFGSYTGNGSADGPFIYCGFRPRFILLKRSDSTGNWFMWDTSRDPYNTVLRELYPDSSSAEVTRSGASDSFDILSNGFKIRFSSTYADRNANGGTYIYAAFAENPFKNSLAR